MSLSLSLAIVLMSPGFNCWAAFSETVSGPNARVDLVPVNMNARMQNIGDNSAANFLDTESPEMPAKELGTVPNSISVTPTKVGVQSHKILLDSGLRIAGVTTKADRKPQSGFKATLTKHAAKIMKATQKIRQAVKNHIAGKIANWSNLFDGASLHPAYAGMGMNSLPKTPFIREAKDLNILEADSGLDGPIPGAKNESVPAPQSSPKGTSLSEANLPGVYQGNFVALDIRDFFTIALNADKTFEYYGEGAYVKTMGADLAARGRWSFSDGEIRLDYDQAPVDQAPYVQKIDVSRQTLESLQKGVSGGIGLPAAVPMDIGIYDGTTQKADNRSGLQKTNERPWLVKLKYILGFSILPKNSNSNDVSIWKESAVALKFAVSLTVKLIGFAVYAALSPIWMPIRTIIRRIKSLVGKKNQISADAQRSKIPGIFIIGAAVAVGAILMSLLWPHLALAASVHAAMGVGGVLATGLLGIVGGIGGVIVGGLGGYYAGFRYAVKTKAGDGVMIIAPVFAMIGAAVLGIMGFFGLPLLVMHFVSHAAAFLAPQAVYAATLTAAHAAPVAAAHSHATLYIGAGIGGVIAAIAGVVIALMSAGLSDTPETSAQAFKNALIFALAFGALGAVIGAGVGALIGLIIAHVVII